MTLKRVPSVESGPPVTGAAGLDDRVRAGYGTFGTLVVKAAVELLPVPRVFVGIRRVPDVGRHAVQKPTRREREWSMPTRPGTGLDAERRWRDLRGRLRPTRGRDTTVATGRRPRARAGRSPLSARVDDARPPSAHFGSRLTLPSIMPDRPPSCRPRPPRAVHERSSAALVDRLGDAELHEPRPASILGDVRPAAVEGQRGERQHAAPVERHRHTRVVDVEVDPQDLAAGRLRHGRPARARGSRAAPTGSRCPRSSRRAPRCRSGSRSDASAGTRRPGATAPIPPELGCFDTSCSRTNRTSGPRTPTTSSAQRASNAQPISSAFTAGQVRRAEAARIASHSVGEKSRSSTAQPSSASRSDADITASLTRSARPATPCHRPGSRPRCCRRRWPSTPPRPRPRPCP